MISHSTAHNHRSCAAGTCMRWVSLRHGAWGAEVRWPLRARRADGRNATKDGSVALVGTCVLQPVDKGQGWPLTNGRGPPIVVSGTVAVHCRPARRSAVSAIAHNRTIALQSGACAVHRHQSTVSECYMLRVLSSTQGRRGSGRATCLRGVDRCALHTAQWSP